MQDIQLPRNKTFGLFFAAVFGLIGTYLFLDGVITGAFFSFSLSLLFGITALIKARVLLPLNKLWMRFGFILGMIVSPLVLGIIFFGMFMPISMITRLFGRDELHLKVEVKATHWIFRESQAISANMFRNQF